jgi:hemerythrin-like metal-binding protein
VSIPIWQDTWTLHIDAMDGDHRALVALLGEIARRFTPQPDEAADAGGHEALMAALEDLGDRTREHFRNEEELMRSIGYPDLAAHRSEHALLVAEYVEMVRELRQQGVTRLEEETIAALRSWLVAHILGADRDLAEFYCGAVGRAEDG